MIVYISLNADKNNKVNHKQGCFYEKRMEPKYRLGIDKVKPDDNILENVNIVQVYKVK